MTKLEIMVYLNFIFWFFSFNKYHGLINLWKKFPVCLLKNLLIQFTLPMLQMQHV